jgi:hypothetical protein
VAVADGATTNEDAPVTLDVLVNLTDGKGDRLVMSRLTQEADGTVGANPDGTPADTPTANFNG